MRLGYYFHAPSVFDGDSALAQSRYAMLAEALAQECGSLVYFSHSSISDFTATQRLGPPLVRAVDMGPNRSWPATFVRPGPAIDAMRPWFGQLDALLVAAPTPLIGAVAKAIPSDLPLVVLMVGDIGNWTPSRVNPAWRNAVIRVSHIFFARSQRRALSGRLLLTLSSATAKRWSRFASDTHVVFTSSLQAPDIEFLANHPPLGWSPGVGKNEPLQLLSTGRIVEAKGILDSIEAVRLLRDRGLRVRLEFVGYDDDGTEKLARELVARHGLGEAVVFGGFAPAGPALLERYREHHAYILPTHGEGAVPQTIKEAMAVGLPVVATDIDAIRAELTPDRHLLVAPVRRPDVLADQLARLVADPLLRSRIVGEARTWAATRTNEASAAAIFNRIYQFVDKAG